ncbi:MAG TPA: FecR family protein [Chitinophaga sp.]
MENNQFSKQLLDRYLAGACTDAEKAIVEGWYNQQLDQDLPLSAQHLQAVENAIWQHIQPTPVRRLRPWKTVAAAASVALLLAAGAYYYFRPAQRTAPLAVQTITAPVKMNNLVELPDGSIVILDKGSKLDFPKTFSGKRTREVHLTGNAYFDVRSSATQPFIVKAGQLTTTVLGTSFDINTRNETISVRVITGKVKVATDKATLGDLEPNRQVTYTAATDQSSFSVVNATAATTWTTQDVQLNDITFDAICRQLEQRYHVHIEIQDAALKEKKFTITLTAGDELKSTLATVCDFNGATYHYNAANDTYSISAVH